MYMYHGVVASRSFLKSCTEFAILVALIEKFRFYIISSIVRIKNTIRNRSKPDRCVLCSDVYSYLIVNLIRF